MQLTYPLRVYLKEGSMSTQVFSEESLIIAIVESLSPTKAQYDLATSRYKTVAQWLADDEGKLGKAHPKLYSQGSFAIGTPNRPVAGNEFDFDFVCEAELHPFELLLLIKARLQQNGIYDAKVEMMNRCIRITYKNDFHIDILPAQPDYTSSLGCVLIPDRKLQRLISTNPKAYAHWFQGQCRGSMRKAFVEAHIEPAPHYVPAERKFVLQNSVQLMKRNRDLYFAKDPDSAPVSIILTTLAGALYESGNRTLPTLAQIVDEIKTQTQHSSQPFQIENPGNPGEILTEKWREDRSRYDAFVDWTNHFSDQIHQLTSIHGIHKKTELLQKMFGESVVNNAVEMNTRAIDEARKNNALNVRSSGVLTASSVGAVSRVAGNTFFGSEEEE